MHDTNAARQTQVGVICAIAAYTMWGIAPLYFKQLAIIPATEVLMHRIVWSVMVLAGLIAGFRQWPKVKAALQSRMVMQTLLVAGVLLGANWLLFIWAINNDHLLDASLGYYINPLFNVFLGRLFLGEKLRPLQQFAVMLAGVGVAVLIFSYGQLPWIALVLALTFGVYGLLRKRVAVNALPGLFIETSIMLPVAVGYWLGWGSEHSDMISNPVSLNLLLVAAGIVTTAPLLCFTSAARRIKYSTLGFFQYIGPSLMFVLAVFLYSEPLEPARLITFGFVWMALVIFSMDSLAAYRQAKKVQLPDAPAR